MNTATAKAKVTTAMGALIDLFKRRGPKPAADYRRCDRCTSKFKVRTQKPEDGYDTTRYCQKVCRVKAAPDGEKSRQQLRAGLRKAAHQHINQIAGGEPRRIRRAMARELGNRRYAERTA